jgi:ribosome-binding protein aMBF1 (putative translation factor)
MEGIDATTPKSYNNIVIITVSRVLCHPEADSGEQWGLPMNAFRTSSARGAKVRLENLKTRDEMLERQLRDPAVRREWERSALARAVASRIVEYRAKHGLSQSALGRQLGMKQPAIARLEAADHNPSVDTLMRLAQGLDMEFHIDVTPEGVAI